jgi:hypothetical protein
LGKGAEFEFYDAFPERAMVGRIYRLDTLGDGPRARTSFEFDALDEASVTGAEDLRVLFLSDDVKPFGLVRVLTTPTRFAKLFGGEPEEGDWYRFQLVPRALALQRGVTKRLTAWHAQLTAAGYTLRSRGYITGAEFLARDGEAPLKSLSAALAPTKAQCQTAIAAAQFPNFKPIDNAAVATLLRGLATVDSVKVHDVGQASFVTLYDADDKPVAHYDAGWPVAFNGETAPSAPPVCQKAPVILSHWDWDHLSGYYRFSNLQSAKWIVPEQHLGFGAGRVATRLDDEGSLMVFNGPPVSAGSLGLGVCTGPAGVKNQSGLAVRVALPAKIINGVSSGPRAALLTGDADYDHAPPALTLPPLHGLLVTHHGANFGGSVPAGPAGRGRAIVSVGRGNRYKHPRPEALRRHASRNWRYQMTMYWAAVPRGPKWIT